MRTRALALGVVSLYLLSCSPEQDETAPPAPSAQALNDQEPQGEPLPALPTSTSSSLESTLTPALVKYVQAIAVCDYMSPGLLDLAKTELRNALGPLWSPNMEKITDEFRDEEGARVAAQLQAAIAGGPPGTRTAIIRGCREDIADHKRQLIDIMESYMSASPP